jgi:hypothetical protein
MRAAVLQLEEIFQPYLFDMGVPDPYKANADREYKRAIDAVLKARREVAASGQERGITQINVCLEALRSISKLTDTQTEERILYAIERQGATTPTEIAEDSRLAITVVKKILANLISSNTLYLAPKFIPGSDRQYFMYKSNRVKTPEVV